MAARPALIVVLFLRNNLISPITGGCESTFLPLRRNTVRRDNESGRAINPKAGNAHRNYTVSLFAQPLIVSAIAIIVARAYPPSHIRASGDGFRPDVQVGKLPPRTG